MAKNPKGSRDNEDAKAWVTALDAQANVVRDESESDIYFYSGPIRPSSANVVLESIHNHKPKLKKATLILCTYGGSPDAAYRIARAFHRYYEEFTVLIDGYCSSAGTLLALGAHELALSNFAMLGPLDTQIAKTDELFENVSGLTGVTALAALRLQAYEAFQATLVDMKTTLPNEVTLKTAIEASLRLTTGLFEPIYAQVDPLRLGEDRRALDIARHYGKRLSAQSDNLKEDTLDTLLTGYPSHGFVIDRDEAKGLFKYVRELTEAESKYIEMATAREPAETRRFFVASDPRKEEKENKNGSSTPNGKTTTERPATERAGA